jgi:signal transduction histidine kinase
VGMILPGVRPGSVSAHAARVAAIAALLTAVLYLGVIVSFDVLDARHLVAQVDARVTHRLNTIALLGDHGAPLHGRLSNDDDVDTAPIVIWRAASEGPALPVTPGAFSLPADAWSRTGDATSAVSHGGNFRLIAKRAGNGWLVAGESLAETQHVEAVVGRAELIAGPVLVLAMFGAALAIGLMASRPLEQARRRQLEFTADASHELRTPVAVIEAETALALSSDRDGDSYRTTLRRIGTEGKRLRHIVEDLLFLARFDAKPAVPVDELVDLVTLAGASVERFAAVAESKSTQLSLFTAGADALIEAPPEWVDRLFGVLIDNACRYAGDGGSVTVTVSSSAKLVTLAVQDSGPGIPPEQRPFLFDRFHRGSNGGEGAGLGLAIADAVVRSTDGKWRVGDGMSGGANMEVSWRRLYARDNFSARHHRRRAERPQDAPLDLPQLQGQ